MHEIPPNDRRKFPRSPYGAWVEDQFMEGSLRFFLAVNLSRGGVLLRSPEQAPEIGHRVRLRLIVENEPRIVSIEGEVIRHGMDNDIPVFAVRFINLDAAQNAFLDDLFREIANESF